VTGNTSGVPTEVVGVIQLQNSDTTVAGDAIYSAGSRIICTVEPDKDIGVVGGYPMNRLPTNHTFLITRRLTDETLTVAPNDSSAIMDLSLNLDTFIVGSISGREVFRIHDEIRTDIELKVRVGVRDNRGCTLIVHYGIPASILIRRHQHSVRSLRQRYCA